MYAPSYSFALFLFNPIPMTSKFMPLIAAQPAFTESGIAKSVSFDDVYHSTAGALKQAEHVFIEGNQLPARWQHQHSFTICETGFGLGNNFLATWRSWRTDPHRCTHLHYLSFEAHPFHRADLKRMLEQSAAEVPDLVSKLLAQWPELLPGIHRLSFEEGNLSLTLVFGDITQKAKLVNAKVDAFYLDGFAPRVNPDMWSKRLFGQLVRLSAQGATLASWCSAGQVRRDLQDAGFVITKAPGFAHKREMIKGALRAHLGRALTQTPKHVVVVGAGIAGASTAAALARRGIRVTVFDPVLAKGLGASHLGHHALAMTPIISCDDAPRARLSRAGLLLTQRYWQPLAPQAYHEQGTYTVATSPEDELTMRKAIDSLGFPSSWVRYVNAKSLSEALSLTLPYGGLFYPKAVLVEPEALIEALLTHPLICLRTTRVKSLKQHEQKWLLQLEGEADHSLANELAEAVILCTSYLAPTLARQALPSLEASRFLAMQNLPGQVSFYEEADFKQSPSVILAGDGYLLPALNGIRVGGSTYGEAGNEAYVSQVGHEQIQEILDRWRPQLKNQHFNAIGGWAGQRAVVSDRLPVFSHLINGLWLNCAYGSNGFSWSALCAEELAAQLCNEPSLLERDLSLAVGLR